MVWRSIAGVALGLALWWLLFPALGIGFGLLWPDYREAARVMMQEGTFRLFTPAMLFTNLLVFAVVGTAVGCIATLVSRSRGAALAIAALLLVYAVVEHYLLLWNQLPDWYNLIVPLVISGFVLLGGRVTTPRAATNHKGK
jgi:hypothetical protein